MSEEKKLAEIENFGKIHITTIYTEIHEDDWEHGMGEDTGCGGTYGVNKTFDTIQDILDYLKNQFDLSDEILDYNLDNNLNGDGKWVLQTTCIVADLSDAQNGGWFKPTSAEIESWKKGNLMLYMEDYFITFHEVRNVDCPLCGNHPMKKELTERLTALGYSFPK